MPIKPTIRHDSLRHISVLPILLALQTVACAQEPVAPSPAPSGQPGVKSQAPGPEDEAQDRGWPRKFETGDYEIIVHQPQVEEWPDFERITFLAALSIGRKGDEARSYGILRVSAASNVALADRLVLLFDRSIELTFPGADPAEAVRLKAAVLAAAPPDRPMTVSLDRLLPQIDASQVKVRRVDVNIAPPKIIASDKPAIMVVFMGKPRFKPVPGADLMFAINTNWDLFLDPATSRYYLLNDKAWLVTDSLEKGSWTAATALPTELSQLPSDDNWSDVRAAIPLVPAKQSPAVFVGYEPTELVVTEGAPEFQPIPGTKLMLVANTESDLFYNTLEKQYYLLAAGRWFKTGELAGPWVAASSSLPEDFKKIPDDSDTSDVLAAVPGTQAAKDAIILASIPQKATVNRKEVTVNVTYDGAPDFRPIESTTVQYAYNSPYNIFLVDGKYYCCHNAVWFVAPTPTGAWAVCDAVPAAIYSIPPTSPDYNVTYVTVYESTPDTVVTGYTSGYYGEVVAATGAVMFGAGVLVGAAIADDDYWHYHYPACYFSYGCGAVYRGAYGGYFAGGRVYGPYGGAGGYAAYNPATGVYSRGAYAYGPRGAAGYRAAYNPTTGNAAYRAGGTNAYSSWGRAGVTNGDEWVRAGYKSGPRGSVGAVHGSEGAGAVHAERRYGNGATVARTQEGDLYAGKDGHVYKKTDDGWEQLRREATPARSNARADQPPPRPGAAEAERPAARDASRRPTAPQTSELQRQASTRERGERNAARVNSSRGVGGHQATPSHGGRRR